MLSGHRGIGIFFTHNGGHRDALFGFDPAAIFSDAAEGAGGGDNSGGGGSRVVGAVENVLEHVAKVAAANGVEAQGVRVTVDRKPVDVVVVVELIGDVARVVPVNEKLLDHLALGVMADSALARMALAVGSGTQEFRGARTSGAKIILRLADGGRPRTSGRLSGRMIPRVRMIETAEEASAFLGETEHGGLLIESLPLFGSGLWWIGLRGCGLLRDGLILGLL